MIASIAALLGVGAIVGGLITGRWRDVEFA